MIKTIKVTCAQALAWSAAANVVLLTLLMLSVVHYPAPDESKQRAAELQQARQQIMQGVTK